MNKTPILWCDTCQSVEMHTFIRAHAIDAHERSLIFECSSCGQTRKYGHEVIGYLKDEDHVLQ